MSFEVGIEQLGAQPMFLNAGDIQLRAGETIKDTANVMSRYVDCIMIRTFTQKDVEDLAEYGQIPVVNGLTDDHHPCQGMAEPRSPSASTAGVSRASSSSTSATATTSPTRSLKWGPRPACTSSPARPTTTRPDPGIIAGRRKTRRRPARRSS